MLNWAYESLTRNDPVRPVDLIFVMAGRMERKDYAVELYRAGIAPRLVLSVGRFEVSKMRALDLGTFEQLVAVRDKTPPDQRHYFLTLDASGTHIAKANLPRWNTYGEIVALHRLLDAKPVRTIIIVSTAVHLRRVALAFASVFRNSSVKCSYCPVPPRFGFVGADRWWARPHDRRFVFKEMIKLAGYRVILSAPAWGARRILGRGDQRFIHPVPDPE